MSRKAFRVSGGLTPELTRLILDDVHQLLAEVGLEIDHPELLRELAGHTGVTVRGNRVSYAPALVEAARKQVPLEDTNYATSKPGDERFLMRPPFSPFDVIDFDTGARRPAEDRDVVEGARLYDAFDCTGPVHVHLARMDQKIAGLHIAKLCAENSRGIGNWSAAYDYEQAACIRDMYLAAGRDEPAVALQMTHSPLRLDAYFLDILMRARHSENGVHGLTAGGGAMPLPGVSAPVYWRSAAAQGLAEALGAWITVKLIDPAIKPYASFLTWAPDLSTCKWASGTPEAMLFFLFSQQVMQELLDITIYADCANLARMCLFALHGTRIFESAGLRRDCLSLAHVPIDREKIHYVEAVAAGIEIPDEPGLTARIVRETFPETTFLLHESTLEYRRLYWQPKVFTAMTCARVGELLLEDSDELLPAAKEIARRKIAGNDFALADDVRREIERIYKRGCRAVRALPR
jgi:trimethylamine:corrinoid methyltransferase-like protein